MARRVQGDGEVRLLHYTPKPFVGPILSLSQDWSTKLSSYRKPKGLWVSVEGEDDWPSWCRSGSYNVTGLACVSEVVLAADHTVLITAFPTDLHPFFCRDDYGGRGVDWSAVAEKHLGHALEVVCDKDHLAKEIWDDKSVRVEKNKGERIK